MTRIVLSVIASLALAGAACSSSSVSTEFSYEFQVNGCTTGKHTFQAEAAYCSALLDDTLNNHCASSERKLLHDRDCP